MCLWAECGPKASFFQPLTYKFLFIQKRLTSPETLQRVNDFHNRLSQQDWADSPQGYPHHWLACCKQNLLLIFSQSYQKRIFFNTELLRLYYSPLFLKHLKDTQKLWHKYNIPLTISIAQSKSHMHLTFCRKRHFHSVISETDNSTLKPHLHGVCFS